MYTDGNGEAEQVSVSNGSSVELMTLTFSLFSLVPPVLSVPRMEYTSVLGQPASLECVADGQPQPEVTWLKERRPVVEGARIQIFANGTLTITSTQRSDAGLYTCSAKNLAGRASHDMRLAIQGELQPEAWKVDLCYL